MCVRVCVVVFSSFEQWGRKTHTLTHIHTHSEQSLGQNVKLQPLGISISHPCSLSSPASSHPPPTEAAGAPHYVVTWKILFSVYYCYCGFLFPACLGTTWLGMTDHYTEYLPGKIATSLSPPLLLHVGKEMKQHQTTKHSKKTWRENIHTHTATGFFVWGEWGQICSWRDENRKGRTARRAGQENTSGKDLRGQSLLVSLLLSVWFLSALVCARSLSFPCCALSFLHLVINTKHKKKDKALNAGGEVLSLSPSSNIW